MAKVKSPENELQDLFDNSVSTFVDRVQTIMRADLDGDQAKFTRAVAALGRLFAQTFQLSDFFGRRRAFLEMDAAEPPEDRGLVAQLHYAKTPAVPNIPFEEALRDLASRQPRLAAVAEEVGEIYAEHGFALARSSSLVITERVQKLLVSARRARRPVPETVEAIADLGPFTRSYAETVYRTNLNQAYNAGRFQVAQDPDIREALPAFEYDAIRDADVRRGRPQDKGENHLALDGLIAPTDSTIWETYSPPNGFNCRCSLRLVSVQELERRGLLAQGFLAEPAVPATAAINPLFARGRPDRDIYG